MGRPAKKIWIAKLNTDTGTYEVPYLNVNDFLSEVLSAITSGGFYEYSIESSRVIVNAKKITSVVIDNEALKPMPMSHFHKIEIKAA